MCIRDSYVGLERATSSVILYVMMHIFSHFWLWLCAVVIYAVFYPVSWEMGIVLGLVTVFCLLLSILFTSPRDITWFSNLSLNAFKILTPH